MALAPYRNLPQEIESLKLVIEIRNEEIQKLKNRNVELEKQVRYLRPRNLWVLRIKPYIIYIHRWHV